MVFHNHYKNFSWKFWASSFDQIILSCFCIIILIVALQFLFWLWKLSRYVLAAEYPITVMSPLSAPVIKLPVRAQSLHRSGCAHVCYCKLTWCVHLMFLTKWGQEKNAALRLLRQLESVLQCPSKEIRNVFLVSTTQEDSSTFPFCLASPQGQR